MAKQLDSRLDAIKERIGKVPFKCYICGLPGTTYTGTLTVPPNALDVHTAEDVRPVATCGRPYCARMETARQDALIQMVFAPQREAYLKRRAEEREKEKK